MSILSNNLNHPSRGRGREERKGGQRGRKGEGRRETVEEEVEGQTIKIYFLMTGL